MPPSKRWPAVGLAVTVALLSLLPLASLAASWAEYVRTVGLPLDQTPALGYDGVRWEDRDGQVVAGHVVRRGTADDAGLRSGDVLLALDYLPVESATAAEAQVDRATGTVLTYSVQRRQVTREVQVRIVRNPTFLYPLTAALWATTGWGFAIVALLHLIAFLTVAPLSARSTRARRSRLLIGAALLWVGGNLLRVLWVSTLGAPGGGDLRGAVFDGLTLLALGGWIAYPALLLDQGLRDRRVVVALGHWRRVLAAPPLLLGAGVLAATLLGHVGPLPPDAFAIPILFYVCVYVGAATAVSAFLVEGRQGGRPLWSRVGSVVVLVLAVVGAVLAWTQLGPGSREADVTAAWFIVLFQLFSLLPVALVSYGVLRHGAFDALLVRTLATLATLALAFVVVVVAAAVLDAFVPGGSEPVALGFVVVVLLLVAEWAAPAIRDRARAVFQTARQRSRQRLDRLGAEIRTVVEVEPLAQLAVDAAGQALLARSAVVFLQAGDDWAKATYRPEAPTFTHVDLDRVWEQIRDQGAVWSRNEELNESALPTRAAERLRRLGVALAVPVTTGRGVPVGLVVLGRKARRLAVYDTEDVERLRALAAQLALAVERLRLLDRERELVRQDGPGRDGRPARPDQPPLPVQRAQHRRGAYPRPPRPRRGHRRAPRRAVPRRPQRQRPDGHPAPRRDATGGAVPPGRAGPVRRRPGRRDRRGRVGQGVLDPGVLGPDPGRERRQARRRAQARGRDRDRARPARGPTGWRSTFKTRALAWRPAPRTASG